MNVPDLEAFVVVVETGSIVGASARLNLTQPGVTRRVQNLEEKLGVRLLDRQSKPLRPTSEGREVYEHGRQILRAIEDLKTSISPNGEVRGEFRIGVNSYLTNAALARPLDCLRDAFPHLELRITTGWSSLLLAQVASGELDAAALCLAEDVDPPHAFEADGLGRHSMLFVAARSLQVPSPAKLEDLAQFPWVMTDRGCGFRGVIRQRLEAARLPFNVAIEVLSADLRLSLVARGLGIGIVTPEAFAASSWRETVEVIEAIDFQPRVRSWIVHRPPAGRLRPAIALFRGALLDALNGPEAFGP